MFKKAIMILLILLCGCSAQVAMVTSGSTVASDGAVLDGKLNEKKVFSAGEECVYRVKTDQPLLVGFDLDLPSELANELQKRYSDSGDFEAMYSGEVSQIKGGSGLGSLHGGYIEMKPKDGLVEFTFINHLDRDFEFEVYAKSNSK